VRCRLMRCSSPTPMQRKRTSPNCDDRSSSTHSPAAPPLWVPLHSSCPEVAMESPDVCGGGHHLGHLPPRSAISPTPKSDNVLAPPHPPILVLPPAPPSTSSPTSHPSSEPSSRYSSISQNLGSDPLVKEPSQARQLP
jgi:hypothetical protein